MNLDQIFRQAIEAKASDIHFAGGEIPRYRIDGALVPVQMPAVGQAELSELLEPIFSLEAQAHLLGGGGPVWRSALVEGIVFSGLACQVGGKDLVATFRLLNNEIPALEAIGFDGLDLLRWIIGLPRGLAVVAGPSLSGKTTTLLSLIEQINIDSPRRIFVVTSQPSYEFIGKAGLITNIQVGRDCRTYEEAMHTAFQLDPDVIATDDLPTEEAVREALLLADTGHLVIANLHAEDSRAALSILMGLGKEGRKEYCAALATHLVAVTGQRLFKRIDRHGRAAAYDWLKADDQLRGSILSGDIESLKNYDGGRNRDQAIRSLIDQGLIDESEALAVARI